ncbi:hypothetical protein [Flavobacterium silvaticum]|uniref:Uncharacterized protein n=1 Tax=Flavobacterium silvaticum TaxID=1852020 RepID=A0A972FVB8_9FLAO|nr:hypothetical protein [Flavobacterium silvaticum]NMH29318.1 hypothetical protein [Flavobacterium silvaticum]
MEKIKLQLTPTFVLPFLALTFVMHEAHEIVHTAVGRLICGCWGKRDFNVWDLCEGCPEQNPLAVLATFAGPAFTFTMIWMGTFMMEKAKNNRQKAFGFSLIFANIPFARIFGAATGGGDEVWGLNLIWQNHGLAWLAGLVIILTITFYPLYKSFKVIGNESPIVWFLVFFILPTYIDQWMVLIIMNSILGQGLLDQYWILGSPMLVTLWSVFVALVFLFTSRNVSELIEKD